MAKRLQLRRGTTAEHSTFTGAVGEVTVDTDKDTVVVHDGSTDGGIPMARADALADAIDYDITLTVKTDGTADFTTINDAIKHLSENYTPVYKNNGFKAIIEAQAGFIMKEQILIDGMDLSWITISTAEASREMLVDRDFLTTNFGTEYDITAFPCLGVKKGGKITLDLIFDCQVVLGSGTDNDNKMGLIAFGSGSSIQGINESGAIRCSDVGVYTRSGGTISAYNMTASSDSNYGVHTRSGGTILANTMTASSDIRVGVYAHSGGTISAYTMTASSNSSIGVYANSGTISAYNMTASSDSDYGVHARSGNISAYTMTVSSNSSIGVYANSGGNISALNMIASNTADSSTYLAMVLGGGMIKSYNGIWTNNGSGSKCNVSAGTISSNGYVNRVG